MAFVAKKGSLLAFEVITALLLAFAFKLGTRLGRLNLIR